MTTATPPPFPRSLPLPRTPDPAAAPPQRWGIMAPGGIAGSFCRALNEHTNQKITAVGSRSLDRATAFAAAHGIDAAHGSYEELVADPNVDVIYVASPHSEHHRHALLAINAGKHVLVEKAFTQNARQAREVVAAAERAGVVVQEAMWTRFLPHIDVVRQLLADGALGEVTTLFADHGQYFAPDPNHRIFNPALAGGALLDLGIYPLSFASFALGNPTSIIASGHKAFTGVDGQVSVILGGPGGSQALVNTTSYAKTPTSASISGTAARIEIPGLFYNPASVSLISRDGSTLTWDANHLTGNSGLCFQAAEVARLIAAGAPHSELLPSTETIQILETVDEIRRQIGVTLPGDNA
ncbi:gfo/Idh/MocA family oxidoreductase [Nakamurella antarctica]|uniref:Gfo/Idh/MocA family oxidoreductase n=1 Tax=Nakamurella antarctica TaxID=1902245 RepID=A0A3G8ZJ00_9ACTN|nr:Gfo/Idh/MocA family oxidoreductase [Nakamurella antarctica]AZI57362.1 gfo/Idh/MocA family oxidoreductase [Nakamurella antarctica]